jgi:tRNA uridine 5-carbamoylmethylation protein Kti12
MSESLPFALIVLVGLPASGKTTLAKSLQQLLKIHTGFNIEISVKIIDTDAIRLQLFGPEFDFSKEGLVIENKYRIIEESISKNTVLIIDDMHYYVSMRHQLFEFANKTQSLYYTILVDTPFDICLKWNIERGETVPNAVVSSIASKFDPMGLKYRWDHPNSIVDMSQNDLERQINGIISSFIQEWQKFTKQGMKSEINSGDIILQQSSIDDQNQYWDQLTRKMVSFIITEPQSIPIVQTIKTVISNKSGKNSKKIGVLLADARKKFLNWLKEDPIRGIEIENLITMLHSFHIFLNHEN